MARDAGVAPAALAGDGGFALLLMHGGAAAQAQHHAHQKQRRHLRVQPLERVGGLAARRVHVLLPLLKVALHRLSAYAEAGAECLYAPGVSKPADIEAIVKEVHPKPVNVLVGSASTGLTVQQLTDLGVRRISVGSALSRAAWGALMTAARGVLEHGTFDGFDGAAGDVGGLDNSVEGQRMDGWMNGIDKR